MSIKIANDTANGNVILKGQNVAGDKTITMPNLDCELAPRMQLMTAHNSTSGTSIDFTGIPAWVKKITVMFSGVSTSGISDYLIQLGNGSMNTTGYIASAMSLRDSSTSQKAVSIIGFISTSDINSSARLWNGTIILQLISGNAWVYSGNLASDDGLRSNISGGSKTLLGTLDRIRVTTVNGTDTFDAGQINVLYEG